KFLAHDARLFQKLFAPTCIFANRLGASETGLYQVYFFDRDTPLRDSAVPAGYHIFEKTAIILDEAGRELPVGAVGEIGVRSRYLPPGYWGQPEVTREKFRDDENGTGMRLYLTGDLGRYRADGCLEFHGRKDAQVKIRGLRIELGEIEAVLAQHPQVRQAVVVMPECSSGVERLAAYVVPQQAAAPPAAPDLRRHLQETLPEYMVPAVFVILETLPLTPSGKLDRKALPAPVMDRRHREQSFVAPRTPVEELLSGIWSRLLDVEEVGIHDNFFELGGASLLATQVIARVRDACEVDLPLSSFFEVPTVAGLAERIERLRTDAPADATPPFRQAVGNERLTLSFAQERLWFLDQLDPGSGTYNMPRALRLRGPLDVAALERSVREIVRRHEAVRTTFGTVDGRPLPVVLEPEAFRLTVTDLQLIPERRRETEVRRLAMEEAGRPFDLSRDLMLRVQVVKLDEQHHVLLMTMHHIAYDGWSMGVLSRELTALYAAFARNENSPLPEFSFQYVDYAVWQREWLQGEELERQLTYWKQQLSGAPAVLELPTDCPRPAVATCRGERRVVTLNANLTQSLHSLSRREGVTPFMTLLAAFQVLLARYSGQEDVSVGVPIAGRNRTEVEGLIGFFVNTLVVRTDLSQNPTFQELLKRVREVTLGAYAHQDLPFERLVEELHPERSLGHSPLFQVMFALQNTPASELELTDITVSRLTIDHATAMFDLTLSLGERNGEFQGTLDYNSDLFQAETIARLVGHFQVLLEGIVADPAQRIGELPLMAHAERQKIVVEWNRTFVDYDYDMCVHDLFEAQVQRTPDAIAIGFHEQVLTYRELDVQANQLAHDLIARGVGPDVLVGLCVERSPQMLMALLAIFRAGGAYVPLDPAYPADRIHSVLNSAAPRLVLTQTDIASRLGLTGSSVVCLDTLTSSLGLLSGQSPTVAVDSTHLAYVIFTSGSTGKPKGVKIPHRAAVNLLRSMAREPGLNARDVLLSVTTIAFDIAVLELFLPLSVGAKVVLATREEAGDGEQLLALLQSSEISVMQATPATWRVLLAAGWTGSAHLKILCGGEALPRELADELLTRADSVWNLYGPTETTVWSAATRVAAGAGPVTIGPPIANTTFYVLDKNLQPVPVGVSGELFIGGDGLAQGYLNQPELTREKFIPNAFSDVPGSRLYRTGDLVRWRTDGHLEFRGRLDNQIKLRGFRIELGEIEAILAQHPQIAQAVVLLREDRPGDKRLVAYVISKTSGAAPSSSNLRQFLSQKLPDYMIPAAFVALEEFPLTENGKIHRQKLPPPIVPAREGHAEARRSPRDEFEDMIAGIYGEVLEIDHLDLDQSFFELGGNSLLAVQAQARINSKLQTKLPLRRIFEAPTIRGLAERIRADHAPLPSADIRPSERSAPRQSEPAARVSSQSHLPSTGRRMFRFLALSDHWLARGVRAMYWGVRSISLPAPQVLIQPFSWVIISLRWLYYFLFRVCVCEPVFKSYLRRCGRRFHTGVYLPWILGKGDLVVGDDVTFGGKCSITFATRFAQNPTLSIGNRSGIGHNCMLTVGKAITIGDRCRIASDVWMFDSGGHPLDADDRAENVVLESEAVRPITIGDDVWIGRRCVIFPGVNIGSGSVVVACSVVMSSVPPYSLVSGHPAKVVGQLDPQKGGR
ncbi:MAG: amino acid adenylation domain-containing protein, partial [Planctomycetes bacterium]|nr:amino acid adenylation domain-containing protein [Planctomycetota bacterium]